MMHIVVLETQALLRRVDLDKSKPSLRPPIKDEDYD